LLDRIGLASIGLFSLSYLLFMRKFAELHIQLPFFDFPVFVGEILLFVCLTLLFMKWIISREKLKVWQYVFFIYLIFVLIKAGYGYSKWGALALRHSALFYYPLFAICSCSFYKSEFFNKRVKSILAVLLIIAARMYIPALHITFHKWFGFTCFILALIVIKKYPKERNKSILFFLFLIFTPYKHFFLTSRMMLLSNAITLTFLIFALVFISKIKAKHKTFVFVSSVICTFVGLVMFGPVNEIMSIVKISSLKRIYNLETKIISEKEGSFKLRNIKPALYNPEFKPLQKKSAPQVVKITRIEVESKIDKARLLLKESAIFLEELKVETEFQVEPQVGQSISVSKEPKVKTKRQTEQTIPAPEESKAQVKANRKTLLYKSGAKVTKALESLREIHLQVEKIGLTDELRKVQSEAKELDLKIKDLKNKLLEKRTVDAAQGTSLFRLYIWRDMVSEIFQGKRFFGFNFGKPFRSKSLEILNLGYGEWSRDGWIEPHNSYLNIVYRAGAVGLFSVLFLFYLFSTVIKKAINRKSIDGILLCGAVGTLLIAANFAVIFELPYNAVPLWSLFGVVFAYIQGLGNSCISKKD